MLGPVLVFAGRARLPNWFRGTWKTRRLMSKQITPVQVTYGPIPKWFPRTGVFLDWSEWIGEKYLVIA